MVIRTVELSSRCLIIMQDGNVAAVVSVVIMPRLCALLEISKIKPKYYYLSSHNRQNPTTFIMAELMGCFSTTIWLNVTCIGKVSREIWRSCHSKKIHSGASEIQWFGFDFQRCGSRYIIMLIALEECIARMRENLGLCIHLLDGIRYPFQI